MRDTSQITNYDEIVESGEYRVETKLVINGVTYNEPVLKSMSTSSALFSDVPSVGNCYSAEIDVVMVVPNVYIPPMAEMKPYVRLAGVVNNVETTSDWIPHGVFYIDTRERSDENSYQPLLTIHGYDAMLTAESVYPEDDPTDYPMTDTDVVDLIAETMGVDVDDRTYGIMTAGYQINLPATYTMREVLGYIASMYAGNFCMSAEGKLRLVGLTDIGIETNYLIEENGNPIVFGVDGTFTNTTSGVNVEIFAEDNPVDELVVSIPIVQTGSGEPSTTNIRPIQYWEEVNVIVSPTPSDEDGTKYSVSLQEERKVYSGSLNFTTGVLTLDRVGYVLDGTESWTRVTASPTTNRYYRTAKEASGFYSETNNLCSHFPNATITTSTSDIGFSTLNRTNESVLCIRPNMSTYNTVDKWKEFLEQQYENGTPVTCVCGIATPITYNLTPVEVETYLGMNYIHADAGDVTVTWTIDTEATHILV